MLFVWDGARQEETARGAAAARADVKDERASEARQSGGPRGQGKAAGTGAEPRGGRDAGAGPGGGDAEGRAAGTRAEGASRPVCGAEHAGGGRKRENKCGTKHGRIN